MDMQLLDYVWMHTRLSAKYLRCISIFSNVWDCKTWRGDLNIFGYVKEVVIINLGKIKEDTQWWARKTPPLNKKLEMSCLHGVETGISTSSNSSNLGSFYSFKLSIFII